MTSFTKLSIPTLLMGVVEIRRKSLSKISLDLLEPFKIRVLHMFMLVPIKHKELVDGFEDTNKLVMQIQHNKTISLDSGAEDNRTDHIDRLLVSMGDEDVKHDRSVKGGDRYSGDNKRLEVVEEELVEIKKLIENMHNRSDSKEGLNIGGIHFDDEEDMLI